MTASFTFAERANGLPLLGHALELRRRPLAFFESVRADGDVVVIGLGRRRAYVINHPELMRQVLSGGGGSFDKGVQFDKIRPLLGNGILFSDEPHHLRQRRLMQPVFHRARIAHYVDQMREIITETTGRWPDGQRMRLERELHALTLRVVAKILFSTELGAPTVAEVERSVPVLLDAVDRWAFAPFGVLQKLPTPGNHRIKAATKRLWAVVHELIAAYRATGIDHGDLLSSLLSAHDASGETMTDAEVYDEAMTMLIAGSETAKNSLSWTCHLLGQHPDVQDRLHDEIEEVLGGRPVQYDDLPKLDYTRRVLTEALRMYTPAWVLTRRPSADVTLGGHRIPAGSPLLLSLYALHRDPVLHPDPGRFDPDRWLTQPAGRQSTYMPFGSGNRSCIGDQFGMAEMTVFLCCLISKWTIAPDPGHTVKPVIRTLLVPDQVQLFLHRRQPTPRAVPALTISDRMP